MTLGVLALVIAAAFAHAGWNLLAKGAEGGTAFVLLANGAATVIWLPVLAIALVVAPGPLGWTAIALMLGSGVLHAIYFTLLQRGYATGDLSLVYPLARGTGPLLSTIAAIALLGEHPSGLALAGALTIVAAVFSLAIGAEHAGSAGVTFALATGVAIASYTLWDKHAVGTAALSPIVYNWGAQAFNTVIVGVWVARRPGSLRRAWDTSKGQALGVGLLSPLAYILVLYALARAPVSYVAPARETSIVIGTLLGTTVLAEGDTRRRLLAAGAIVLGVTALALG